MLPDRLPLPARGRGSVRGIRAALERAPVARRARPTSTASRSARAARTTPRAAPRRCSPTRSGCSARAAPQATPGGGASPAIPRGRPQRRFERLFERLALPGFGRTGRYDLLVTLGRLGLYELRADSLHLAGARGRAAEDPTTAGRQARVRDRRPAAARAPRGGARGGDRGAGRGARPGARQLGARAARRRSGCPPETLDEGALERAGERARALSRGGRREVAESAVHTAAYSPRVSCSQPPRESRCHSASSSLRMRSA